MSELESPLDAPAAQGGQNCRYKYTASLLLVAVAAGVIALVAVNHASQNSTATATKTRSTPSKYT
jgi:hypothetical protein